ncbi:MAG: nucleotide exchange factor GrpE [Bacteroidota bacterium]|nr:nucleotide exchange factor GrpE [Bacteroidota bacterium]
MANQEADLQPEEAASPETVEETTANTAVGTEEVDEVSTELARVKDQLLRKAAEHENYRRRISRQREEWSSRARAQVVRQLLPILDDLDLTIQAADQSQPDAAALASLKSGVRLVHRNFGETLGKLGVKPIDAIGEPFDENLHEAVMQAPAVDDAAADTVLHEIKRGYVLGEIVLRHSQVIVSVEPVETVPDDPVEETLP